jgi:hypothetical protein
MFLYCNKDFYVFFLSLPSFFTSSPRASLAPDPNSRVYAAIPNSFVPQASPEALAIDDNTVNLSTSKQTHVNEIHAYDSPKRIMNSTEVTLSTNQLAGTPARTTSSASGVQRSTSRISLSSPPIAIHGATPTRSRSLNPLVAQGVTFIAQEEKSPQDKEEMNEKVTSASIDDMDRKNNNKRAFVQCEENQEDKDALDSAEKPPRVKRR